MEELFDDSAPCAGGCWDEMVAVRDARNAELRAHADALIAASNGAAPEVPVEAPVEAVETPEIVEAPVEPELTEVPVEAPVEAVETPVVAPKGKTTKAATKG